MTEAATRNGTVETPEQTIDRLRAELHAVRNQFQGVAVRAELAEADNIRLRSELNKIIDQGRTALLQGRK